MEGPTAGFGPLLSSGLGRWPQGLRTSVESMRYLTHTSAAWLQGDVYPALAAMVEINGTLQQALGETLRGDRDADRSLPVYREPDAAGLRSLVPDGARLPRQHALLRWEPGHVEATERLRELGAAPST